MWTNATVTSAAARSTALRPRKYQRFTDDITTLEDFELQYDHRYSALLAKRAKQGGIDPTSHSPGPPMDPNR